MPHLRIDRQRQVTAPDLPVRDERDRERRRIADRLREQSDLVVEVRRRTQAAVPPRGVAGAAPHHRTALLLRNKTSVHRRAHEVNARDDQRMQVEVHRIAERRREHHRPGRAGLVVIVHDLRIPLGVHHAAHVARLGQRVHVRVTVVVVARVLLVEARNTAGAPAQRVGLAHVPVRHQLHAVGVGVRHEDDRVTQEALRFVVGAAHDLPRGLDQLLCAEHFGGVQAAIDPDDGLAFVRQAARFGLGDAFGTREPCTDLAIAILVPQILGRRDDRHDLRAPFFGQPDRIEFHPVRLAREALEVLVELGVIGQLIVGADPVPEELLRRGQPRLGAGDRGGERDQHEQGAEQRVRTTHRGGTPSGENANGPRERGSQSYAADSALVEGRRRDIRRWDGYATGCFESPFWVPCWSCRPWPCSPPGAVRWPVAPFF